MMLGDRLRTMRIGRSLTQKDVADAVGVSVVTVRNWESGTKNPSMSAIVALCRLFSVSSDVLIGIPQRKRDNRDIPMCRREAELVSSFRTLDEYGKTAVEGVCRVEYKRVSEWQRKQFEKQAQKPRYIPKYLMPSAAGFSMPLDVDDFEMIPVDETVPAKADFAVNIQGNSMEPYIKDGDVVYVEKTQELNVGDVGIFCVDGALYCKMYFIDRLGKPILASANQKMRHTNIYIDPDCCMDVRCFGRVLLRNSIPTPSYLFDNLSNR